MTTEYTFDVKPGKTEYPYSSHFTRGIKLDREGKIFIENPDPQQKGCLRVAHKLSTQCITVLISVKGTLCEADAILQMSPSGAIISGLIPESGLYVETTCVTGLNPIKKKEFVCGTNYVYLPKNVVDILPRRCYRNGSIHGCDAFDVVHDEDLHTKCNCVAHISTCTCERSPYDDDDYELCKRHEKDSQFVPTEEVAVIRVTTK